MRLIIIILIHDGEEVLVLHEVGLLQVQVIALLGDIVDLVDEVSYDEDEKDGNYFLIENSNLIRLLF